MAGDRIVVFDSGREVSFSFDEMLNYHGGGSPGGVAHAFKVLERGLPLLDTTARLERRMIFIDTAFGGPGARDAFELVTRAVSEQRLGLHRSLTMPGVSATVYEEIAALRRVAGDQAAALIRDEPDEMIARLVGGWPRAFDARRAAKLGFVAETDFDEIVRVFVDDERRPAP